MIEHQCQARCFPLQEENDFGGDEGGFIFDSPCRSAETSSQLYSVPILSPGKKKSDQQVADELNAVKFPMALNCRRDLIDEADDEGSDPAVEAVDLLIESNADSFGHANAESNIEASNSANQSLANNDSVSALDLSYIDGENNREFYAKESEKPFGGLGMIVSLADRKPRPIDHSHSK